MLDLYLWIDNFFFKFIQNYVIFRYTGLWVIFILIMYIFISKVNEVNCIAEISLMNTLITFIFSYYYCILDNTNNFFYYCIYDYVNLFWDKNVNEIFNVSLYFDAISIWLIILTNLLVYLCILYHKQHIKYDIKMINIQFLLLVLLLSGAFLVTNVLLFFILFESVIIPMLFIIGIWGSRQRKIHALYYFLFYTMFGSVCSFLGLLLIYVYIGNFELNNLYIVAKPLEFEILLFILLFIGFSVKVPLWPVHIWLPEAHVESPTTGSVILAGILLKLGTYGLLRILLPITPNACIYCLPLVYVISVLGVLYCSIVIIRQIDLKKIIAYSSVIHMSYSIIGLFSLTESGICGSIFLMFNHGLVASALFFCIGVLYERYHTRLIFYYGGLAQVMPLFGCIFFIFTLANIGLPGTSSFIGEFLVLIGIWKINMFIAFLINLSVIFSVVYGIWLYNRVMFGKLTNYFKAFSKISVLELLIFIPLLFWVILLGLHPDCYIAILDDVVFKILYGMKNLHI